MTNQEKAQWYILHTYSGYENMVKTSVEQLVENAGLQESILDIKIPTETVVEEKANSRKVYEAKVMPCYVFIKLRYNAEIWYLLTNTRGITGFVGPNGKAVALSDDEVKRLGLETYDDNFDAVVGDRVTVVSGPFTGLLGEVISIDTTHQKAKVMLNMMGRETPVDMDFVQIEKITNNVTTVVVDDE